MVPQKQQSRNNRTKITYSKSIYAAVHKKLAASFLTVTPTFLGEFTQFVNQRKQPTETGMNTVQNMAYLVEVVLVCEQG